MATNGNGSLSSPIVISDDEDAAFVEQELGGFEARLSDPEPAFERQMVDVPMYDWGQQAHASSSRMLMQNNSSNAMQAPAPLAGQKRKRKQYAQDAVPNEQQETKSQRKKRRRAERLAAKGAELATEQDVDMQDASPAASRMPARMAPLPDRPVGTYRDAQHSGILPPMSWSASFSAHTAVMPQSFIPSLPLKPPPSMSPVAPPPPDSFSPFSAPAYIPHTPERRQQPPHIPVPAPAPHIPLPKPLPPAPDATSTTQISVPQKKLLGMPRESDRSGLGLFPSELLRQPLPDPSRTLVLAPIPKKFRNPDFLRHWVKRFARPLPLRAEVDKAGKALVEFQSVALAEMAFGSQRMAGEGKEHIRAWWYRGAAKNPADLEEGEIEEGVVEAPVAPQAANKKMSKKDKKAEKRKAQALQPKQNKPRAPPALPKLPPANGSRAFPNYNRQQSVASAYSGVPMPVPLPLPQPPPIASSSGPSNYVPKTSPPAQPPQPAAQPPSSPYGYRGWADHLEQVEKYGVMSSDDGSEYEGPSAEAERSWYYSAGPRRRDPSYHEEEQAMDLESDDEDLPDPKEEHFIQESRYGVWGEPATGADVTAADSASIASSREASAERGQEERMRVDDAGPATTRTPPATEHAVTVPQSLPSSSRPKPEVTIPDLPVQTSRPQPLSPSAYTMVEPPAASVPASALTIVPTAPSTSATEPTHPIAVASPSTLTSPVSALKPLPAAPLVTSLKDPSLELPKVPLPQPVVSQRSESAAPALAESVPVVSAKRTLQEKQRELEERIARAKEELAQKNVISRAGSSRHTSPEEENDKPAATSSRAGEEAISSPTEILSTQELRRSALQSRKKAGIASIPSAGNTQEKESTVALSDTSTVVGDDAPSAAAVPKGSAINFDELAVSFITETLQTMQPSPRSDSPPAAAAPVHVSQPAPPTAPATPQPRTFTQSHTLAKSSQAAEKVLLAARQKRLEQHIAETKVLMAKLTTARSKAEKENILGMLRERQRAMDGDMKADAPLKPVSSSPPSSFATNGYSQPFKSQATHAWKTHWPEPSRDAMILVISDDEDDD